MPNPSEIERCCQHHCLAPDCDCMRGRGKQIAYEKDNRPLEDLLRDEQEAMRKKREASNETA